jgi:hypothetical protein
VFFVLSLFLEGVVFGFGGGFDGALVPFFNLAFSAFSSLFASLMLRCCCAGDKSSFSGELAGELAGGGFFFFLSSASGVEAEAGVVFKGVSTLEDGGAVEGGGSVGGAVGGAGGVAGAGSGFFACGGGSTGGDEGGGAGASVGGGAGAGSASCAGGFLGSSESSPNSTIPKSSDGSFGKTGFLGIRIPSSEPGGFRS